MTPKQQVILALGIGIGIGYFINLLTDKNTPRDTLEELQHVKCNKKIESERRGRIKAEQLLRKQVVERISDPSVGYPLIVIGSIKSPYLARRGTPRQGLLVPDSRSIIKLSSDIPKETLDGLDTYSHLFIHFIFHENTNLVKTLVNDRIQASKSGATFSSRVKSFAARVLPPLLQGGALGLFATRSPHRPNAIGQSLVKIESVDVESRSIVVSGADLVDGTPIFDLKPWGPFDCPTCIHNVVTHTGIQECIKDSPSCLQITAKVPDWVLYGLSNPYKLRIEWPSSTIDKLREYVKSGVSNFYKMDEYDTLQKALTQILSLDIRSVHRGRGGGAANLGASSDLIGEMARNATQDHKQSYEVEYDVFHIDFSIHSLESKPGDPWIVVDDIRCIT